MIYFQQVVASQRAEQVVASQHAEQVVASQHAEQVVLVQDIQMYHKNNNLTFIYIILKIIITKRHKRNQTRKL
jgi:hypothetical protein